MAVKKREWTTPKGELKVAWVAETFHYKDGKQQRAIKTFRTKKEADAYAAQTKVNIVAGITSPTRRALLSIRRPQTGWPPPRSISSNGQRRTNTASTSISISCPSSAR